MARSFVGSSSQYLKRDVAAATGPPFTMACWFKSDDITSIQYLMCVVDGASDNNYHNLLLAGTVSGDPIYVQSRDTSGTASAITTTGYSADTWHHACAVFAAANSRAAYIDGGSKGTDSTSKSPTGIDRTGIGALVRPNITGYMSGAIAEAAIWNVALTDAEVGILAKGYSPLFVRPQNLTCYWPLLQVDVTSNPEIIGKLYLADYNSPGMAVHPRVIYPAPPISFMAAGGITPLLLRAIEKY